MIRSSALFPAVLLSLVLFSCQQAPFPAEPDPETSSPTEGGVERIENSSSEQAVEPSAQAAQVNVIETQLGPEGSQVELTRAKVTGDVLTVQFRVRPGEKSTLLHLPVKDTSVVDDATSQRYGVLKDSEGNWMASPISNGSVSAVTREVPVIWYKFPAPPPSSKTISINIPGIGPFDGVEVQR